ncbi:beta-ketoacyl-ACP reductase [Reticulibacter mediterranei]|uniref:Beta-ketoacyl-ACP reductase n=1 Tax=Reticulibacter mediterranei TaxID=2778369 RepID=A0A8J3N4H9_9CHLR|nr:SDR family oxidoreductase [Reticulibacter mediterranei]GHO94112.1 beta-ketoacyl-ACP reductase [Reticulibacter mediterranei]
MQEHSGNTGLLQGQVALITGGSRGIGAATARLFARHGAAVGVNYHASAKRAEEVVAAIRAEGGRAIAVQASVDNDEQVAAMVQQVEQELGPIDTLVMNAIAGSKTIQTPETNMAYSKAIFAPFVESSWETYQNMVLRALAGIYIPARIVAPLMIERKRGNLIAVSSLATRIARPGSGAIAASKGSVDALMRVLASELGPHGIRVNVVAPGAIETEASAAVIQERREMLNASLPLRRVGQPEDVAGAILLLATNEARYLTGNYLAAGGGSYLL